MVESYLKQFRLRWSSKMKIGNKWHYISINAIIVQAILSLSTTLMVGAILAVEQFYTFSLLLATGQFLAIFMFEWLRLATTRYYPGASSDTEAEQRSIIYYEFLCCVGTMCTGALLFSIVGVVKAEYVACVVLLAIGQGATDIVLTALRFRSSLALFSFLQTFRAGITAVFVIVTAICVQSAVLLITASAASMFLTILVALITDPRLRLTPRVKHSFKGVKEHLSYGLPAAAASISSLGSVLLLRFSVSSMANTQLSSGVLFSLDIMQRPFNVIIAALHSILYPPVVRMFDRGDATKEYRRLLVIELSSCILLLCALEVVLPFSEIIVPSKLMPGFSLAAQGAFILFGVRSISQNISYIKFQLYRKTHISMIFSLMDFAMYAAGAAIISATGASDVRSVLIVGSFISGSVAALSFIVGRKYPIARQRDGERAP